LPIFGHTAAFTMPTTRPASNASGRLSMSKPGSTAASSTNASVFAMATTTPRRTTWRQPGNSRCVRMVTMAHSPRRACSRPIIHRPHAGATDPDGAYPRWRRVTQSRRCTDRLSNMETDSGDPRDALAAIDQARHQVGERVAAPLWFHLGLGALLAQHIVFAGFG